MIADEAAGVAYFLKANINHYKASFVPFALLVLNEKYKLITMFACMSGCLLWMVTLKERVGCVCT